MRLVLAIVLLLVLPPVAMGYKGGTERANATTFERALNVSLQDEWLLVSNYVDIWIYCPERREKKAQGCKYHFTFHEAEGEPWIYSERGRVDWRGRWLRKTASTG